MQVEYLSATRLETYLQCPKKYYYIYEKGYDNSTDNTRFGKLIHDTLEHVLTVEPIPDNVIDYAQNRFKEAWPSYGIMDGDYFAVGYAMLQQFFFDNDYSDWRRRLIDGPEKQFEIKLDNNVTITGFIDLVMEKDDNTLQIVDFKTSVVPKSTEEASKDIQMSIYYLAAKELYPSYQNIELMLYYLRHGPVVTTRPDGFINRFKDYLVAMYYQILNDNEPKAMPSPISCSTCPGKYECEVYKNYQCTHSLPSSLEEAVELYKTTKAQISMLNSYADELEEYIKQCMETANKHSIQVNDVEVNLITPKQLKYDPVSVYEAVPLEIFLKVVTVGKKELEKQLKDKPELLNKVRKGASYVANKPYISLGRAKNYVDRAS